MSVHIVRLLSLGVLLLVAAAKLGFITVTPPDALDQLAVLAAVFLALLFPMLAIPPNDRPRQLPTATATLTLVGGAVAAILLSDITASTQIWLVQAPGLILYAGLRPYVRWGRPYAPWCPSPRTRLVMSAVSAAVILLLLGPTDPVLLTGLLLVLGVVLVVRLVAERRADLDALRPADHRGRVEEPAARRRAAAHGALQVAAVLLAAAALAVLAVPSLQALAGAAHPAGGGTVGPTYAGFGDVMDTDSRTVPGTSPALVVDADVPDFWRGQTFDEWDGRTWRQTQTDELLAPEGQDGSAVVPLFPGVGSAPSTVPAHERPPVDEGFWQHVTHIGGGDLVFAAPDAWAVHAPGTAVLQRTDGTLRLEPAMAPGTSYTVWSRRVLVTADDLRRHDPRDVAVPAGFERYLQLPDDLPPRVADLAETISAGAPSTYDALKALEGWMGEQLTYRRDIPVPPPGADAVDHLLFVERQGFCEQIGSAMTVMARTLGIPARLAVGFVPGEYDAEMGGFVSTGDMAHAWVEVWFPGIGWQGFDPTASVPLAGDSVPPSSRAAALDALLASLPLVAALAAAAMLALAIGTALRRWGWSPRRRRSAAAQLDREVARMDELGAHTWRSRAAAETLSEYADALARTTQDARWTAVGDALSRLSYASLDEELLEQAGALLDEMAERPTTIQAPQWSVPLGPG